MINVFAKIEPRGPVSILTVFFLFLFLDFVGGERFPTEEVVIVFLCCVTPIVWKS